MAKSKTTKVSDEAVSQVENGSVVETVETETIAEIKEATAEKAVEEPKEEKVEISEAEKVKEEIDDDSEGAEEEANSVDDKVVVDADKSEDAHEEEHKKGNEKYFSFDKKEARKFMVDPDHFLSVIFYKRLLVGIRGSDVEKISSLIDYSATVYSSVEALIRSLRFDDIDYQPFQIDEFKCRDGYDVTIMSIDVPFTDKTPLFINRVRKLVNEFQECYVRSSTNCRTCIDTTRTSTPSLIKGFATFASYTKKKDDSLKVTARSAAFVQKYMNLDDKDVSDLNRYILSSTKINTVSDEGIVHKLRDGTESVDKYMNYFQTMKSKIVGMIYEVTDAKDGKFLVNRVQYYIRICTKKVYNAIIPTRIKIVTSKLEPAWMENLQDIFTWNDPENKAGFLGNNDLIGTDPNVINLLDDIEQIQKNILDNVDNVEKVTEE